MERPGAESGTVSVPMTADVMVGIAVTSRMPSRLMTATFDKVAVAKLAATPATPPAGPVAAWSFDDGAGRLLQDSLWGELDGVITGATWTTAGRNAGALLFNGVDQMVTVPANRHPQPDDRHDIGGVGLPRVRDELAQRRHRRRLERAPGLRALCE